MTMDRRALLLGAISAAAVGAAAPMALAEQPLLRVLKSPTCGCCDAWVEHMRAAGFRVEPEDVDGDRLAAAKAAAGLTPEHVSCHTGFVDGYVIEGHVPAEDVRRLLSERPDALGLAVPGMPIGSPGMEMGATREAYDVMLVKRDGGAEVFSSR